MSLLAWLLGAPVMGAKLDAPDPRDWAFPKLGLAQAEAGDVDLRHPSCPVRDQRSTGSCVGQSAVVVLQLAYLADGKPCPQLSALDAYYSARELEGGTIRDDGTSPRLAWKAIQDHGVASEAVWPFSVLGVNKRPSWGARHEGHARRTVKAFASCRTLDEIEHALKARRPVQASWRVFASFMSHGSGVLDEQGGKFKGRHAMAIVGVERVAGRRVWLVQNSWGTGWGERGCFRCADAFMADSYDRRAIDVP